MLACTDKSTSTSCPFCGRKAACSTKISGNCRLPELVETLKEMFATKDRVEWVTILRASECIFAPVQSPSEVPNDPQVVANDYILKFPHPAHGEFRVAASPVQFGQQGPEVRRAATAAGADTEEVLLELGYTWEEIGALKDHGAIS